MKLSETQEKVLRALSKWPNGHGQVGGHCGAPRLQAARALVRRGLLIEYRTSQFAITKAGDKWLEEHK